MFYLASHRIRCIRLVTTLSILVAFGASAFACSGSVKDVHVTLGHVAVGAHRLDPYAAFSYDSADLGFAITNTDGSVHYFPLHASTTGSLPPGILEIYTNAEEDAVWFTTTWRGYELLGYHRFGTNYSISRYGQVRSNATPFPASIGGDPEPIPALPLGARKVSTLTIISVRPK